MSETISAEFPYESRYVEVNGSRMHYVEQGTGDPILLLLAFEPGAIIGAKEVDWCRAQFPTLQVRHLGIGIHFVQEDQPDAIGKAVHEFFAGALISN